MPFYARSFLVAASFHYLSTEFVWNLCIEPKRKMIESYFKISGNLCESYKSKMTRFETKLLTISEFNHPLITTTFMRGLFATKRPIDRHLMIDTLILN